MLFAAAPDQVHAMDSTSAIGGEIVISADGPIGGAV